MAAGLTACLNPDQSAAPEFYKHSIIMALEIIILAAGQGSRMKSDLPKVMHTLAGKSLLEHVLDTANILNPGRIHVVIGHQATRVSESIDTNSLHGDIHWVSQHEQLGTGHAVAQALPDIDPASTVQIIAGDVPLIQPDTLRPLIELESGINLLTAILPDASGFGRVIRDAKKGAVTAIIEHKDANQEQLAIKEVSTGVMAAKAADLKGWLSRVKNNNAQGEYYLPDIIALAVKDLASVKAITARDTLQISGINSRNELAKLERRFQQQLAEQLLADGVGLADPNRIDIRGKLTAGRNCFIDINTIFEENVALGDNVVIGPNVLIRNSIISDECTIKANSIVDNAQLSSKCIIGPFAHIRPDTKLHTGSKIGNFVEIKNSEIGQASKANHLSYIGDSKVGRNVNIGAGVITCNYDGVNKHRTIIGDEAFIGSDCQLIAPVEIGAGATIGAGSTISKNAPAGKLSLSRSKQIHIDNWQRPVKK